MIIWQLTTNVIGDRRQKETTKIIPTQCSSKAVSLTATKATAATTLLTKASDWQFKVHQS